MREELHRLLAEGIDEQELAEARSYLVGREPFRRETVGQRASLMAEAELLGQPVDEPEWLPSRLLALDKAEVEEAARRHLQPQKLRVTQAMPKGGSGR
jgi:zinc protease